jgi:hypothetical protein
MTVMQQGHPAPEHYLGLGDLQQETDDMHQRVRTHGDPDRQLALRQAPLHARVALGKEKGKESTRGAADIWLINLCPQIVNPSTHHQLSS